MARSEFLQNLRTAASFLAPKIQSGNGDEQGMDRALQSAVMWLTPAAVVGYASGDFPELPKEQRSRLSENVKKFATLAQTVPSNRPATPTQVQSALRPFLTILGLLKDYLDRDAARARQLLEDQDWPDYVVGLSCEAGHDWSGDPCLRITIVIRDEDAEGPNLAAIGKELREIVSNVMETNGIELWPYVTLRSASEREAFYAKTA